MFMSSGKKQTNSAIKY